MLAPLHREVHMEVPSPGATPTVKLTMRSELDHDSDGITFMLAVNGAGVW